MYKIKEIPFGERPRERLKQVGPTYLSDAELLAIILKTGTKNKNVKDLSTEILKNNSLQNFKNITFNSLIQIKGIGEVKAIELLATIELGRRIFLPISQELIELGNPQKIYLALRNLFISKNQEYFYALYFNTKRQLISKKLLFIGTINESVVHPREVFKEAYLLSAAYIICLHNHPSNDTTPSNADIDFTNQIMKIGQIQGIPVVDHLIIGKDNYYSFYERKSTKVKELLWKRNTKISLKKY